MAAGGIADAIAAAGDATASRLLFLSADLLSFFLSFLNLFIIKSFLFFPFFFLLFLSRGNLEISVVFFFFSVQGGALHDLYATGFLSGDRHVRRSIFLYIARCFVFVLWFRSDKLKRGFLSQRFDPVGSVFCRTFRYDIFVYLSSLFVIKKHTVSYLGDPLLFLFSRFSPVSSHSYYQPSFSDIQNFTLSHFTFGSINFLHSPSTYRKRFVVAY